MSEKTRSINVSATSGISGPTLISGPISSSSSPSSLIGIAGGSGVTISVGSGVGIATTSSVSSYGSGGASHLGLFQPQSNLNSSNLAAVAAVSSGGVISGGTGFHAYGTGGGNDTESEGGQDYETNIKYISAGDNNSIMNSSQISTTSNDSISIAKPNINLTHTIVGGSCRFPKLEECAHFHYERVQLGSISIRLVDDKSDLLNSSIASQSIGGDVGASTPSQTGCQQSLRLLNPSSYWFIVKVISSRSDPFLIKRSLENVRMLDEMLHRCVYDRKISGLKDLNELELKTEEDVDYAVAKYFERFSKIASDSLTCGTILTWFQLDNKGRRLPLADTDTMRSINTPAVGAAYGVRRYVAQACDEISIEVGDMISVIDMPSPAESIWWRGKKSHLQKSHYEVGFFPQSCVATIGDKVPRYLPLPAPLVGQLDVSPTKPVLRKHGKLIAFFRSFILSRPSRRRLKQSGIYRERVFSCDLSEHLLNSGQEIPMVLKCCAEFIEENGIVDGIYRLSGITSNIQKLRRAFDEERIPDLAHPEIRQDIHAVSSLLKMYFRELPNPLCTYQLYDNFVEAIQSRTEPNDRLRLMKQTVLKLPPPHYRTLKYLTTHLYKISKHSANTGMTDKNLAIVWAPNLLRSPALESGGVAALRGVGVQAVVTEYLIRNCNLIFDPSEDFPRFGHNDQKLDSLTDCESLLVEQREHDQSLCLIERPKSLTAGGAKLISLEEAQERHSRLDTFDANKAIPINTPSTNIGSYIEVGGGPSSLPDKYHTVLPVPRSWQKRKTHSWKSLFTRNPRNSNSNNDIKAMNTTSPVQKEQEVIIQCSEVSVSKMDKQPISTASSITISQKPKSIDLFDGGKPMDVCVRSNSIDSLRTAGHSRSVSHDSYFDLLQSPLRTVATCPSRELSELGLNFDREEPEMRIFSESESLVSSPKVGKENIPPSRRVLRARPEEFSSATNSVNPSPKKQPRLNILSPTEVPSWATTVIEERHADESCCKRYKLEDQLSDIQFIDCNTPEHTINNPNTIYTSVQVHNPPKSLSKSSSCNEDAESVKENKTTFEAIFENKHHKEETNHINTRYSYPGVQLGGKRKDNDSLIKERFSYPGSNSLRESKYVCRMPTGDLKMNIEEEKRDELETNRQRFPLKVELTKPKNRYSYCEPTTTNQVAADTNASVNFLLRSNSADIAKNTKNEMERSKLSVATPSSPEQSPRYSLLVGETSSENSSTINTPVYDMDLPASHNCNGDDDSGGNCSVQNYNTKDFSCLVSEDSCNNLTSQLSHSAHDKRDISALKRELSLDLEGGGSKMSVDLTDVSVSSNNKQINVPPSPNNSNFTHTSDNTSQSITPSEFGYQHLNRQSNLVSLENSPKSDTYDQLEQAFLNYDKTGTANILNMSPTKGKAGSPIKSTISITYNLKSPVHNKYVDDIVKEQQITGQYETMSIMDSEIREKPQQKPLLETSFDENMVYEQVKFFRSSVSEVNQMLNNGNEEFVNATESQLENQTQIVPDIRENVENVCEKEVNSNLIVIDNDEETIKEPFSDPDDVLMSDNVDSLEIDQSISLYENVELRKPASVYENIEISPKRNSKVPSEKLNDTENSKTLTDSPSPVNSCNEKPKKPEIRSKPPTSPSSFSVKQLATKFETSPVDQLPPFEFGFRSSKKYDAVSNRDAPCYIRAKNHNKELNKSAQITRSLDENAFIREFGQKRLEDVTKSVQQIGTIDETRRKSLEFTRPKCLNPPKRLQNLDDKNNIELCKSSDKIGMVTGIQSVVNGTQTPTVGKFQLDLNKGEEKENNAPKSEVKITPTTENRISLIQNNVIDSKANSDDDRNSPNLQSMKVLSGVKLDRERIERIKEERRHQLSEKYRTESFKSKSKTELRDFIKDDKYQSESLRVKSKSRGDVRSLQKEIDNFKNDDFTLSNRVRRISDEKNQNNFDQTANIISNSISTVPNTIINTISTTVATTKVEDYPTKATIQKFERKSVDYQRERDLTETKNSTTSRNSINSTREKISPQFSIRDVTAMFESRSQNQ